MKKQIVLLVMISCLLTTGTMAQDVGFGFKVGLNSTTIGGPSEMNNEANLETTSFLTGFHVGTMVTAKFNKRFGVRGEVLFSQFGGRYKYEGPSYQSFTFPNGQTVHSTGNRRTIKNVTNNYIYIPAFAYAYPVKKIRLGVGPYVGFLVSSRANGESKYSGQLLNGSNVEEYTVNLEHNYFSDEVGAAVGDATVEVLVGSDRLNVPATQGAYYNYTTLDGNFYNSFDFGLCADFAFKLTTGLELGVRANYGLTDVTNDFYNVSMKENSGSPDFAPIQRNDNDTNLSVMFSVGFGF